MQAMQEMRTMKSMRPTRQPSPLSLWTKLVIMSVLTLLATTKIQAAEGDAPAAAPAKAAEAEKTPAVKGAPKADASKEDVAKKPEVKEEATAKVAKAEKTPAVKDAPKEDAPKEDAPKEDVAKKPEAKETDPAKGAAAKKAAIVKALSAMKFQFDGVPYAEVIRRFAQAADKPLLGDTPLEGTLTFFDTKSYTYAEAFDTLNLILAMQGYVLREEGRFLRLRKLAEMPAMTTILKGLDDTRKFRPGEFVTVVLPLKHVPPADAAKSVIRLVSTGGSISPLEGGTSVVITDTLTNIRRVKSMLDLIDQTAPDERKLQVIPIKYTSASSVVSILQRILGGSGGSSKYITDPKTRRPVRVSAGAQAGPLLIADDAANLLLLYVTDEQLARAKPIIASLDKARDAAEDIRVFHLVDANADEVSRMIKELLAPTKSKSKSAKPAPRIVTDSANNRILVSASYEMMLRVEALVKKLDTAASEENTAIRIVRLEVANATKLQPIISKVFSPKASRAKTPAKRVRGKPAPKPAPKSTSPGRSQAPLQVTAEARTNSLILAGDPTQIELATRLIQQLDQKPAVDAREIRVIACNEGNATEDAKKLLRLLNAEEEKVIYRGRSYPRPTDVHVEADVRNNTLVISARVRDWPRIETLLKTLKTSGTSERAIVTRLVPVKHANVAELASTLASGMRGLHADQTGWPALTILPYARSNMLLVTGARGDQARVAEMLEVMDLPTASNIEIRTYTLSNGKASDVAAMLSRLFAESKQTSSRRPTTPTVKRPSSRRSTTTRGKRSSSSPSTPITAAVEKPRFEYDNATNQIIIAATAEQFVEIEALVKKLQATNQLTSKTKTYKLKFVQASDMLEMLQSVVAPASSSRRNYAYYGGNTDANVRLAALKTANAIVAQGPPERLALVDELVTSFDVKANEDSMAIRIVKLRRARASTLVKSLSTLLAGKKSTFTNPYRYYYGETSPDSETRVDKVTITAETNSNSVLVKGPTRQVKAIVGVIQEIDRESQVDDVAVRTYVLKKADAGELSEAMKSIFRTVLWQQSKRTGTPSAPFAVAANAQANTLVVTTTEAYFATVEKIIADFEDQPLVERDVEYVFLKSADAFTVASQLDELFSGSEGTAPSIETDAESNSLTLIGTETSLAMARKVIEKLDAAAAKGAVCVRVVAITDIPAEKMAEMLKRLYTPMTKSNVVIKKNIDEEAAKKDDKKDTKKDEKKDTKKDDTKDTKKGDKKTPEDKSVTKSAPAAPAVIDPEMPTVTISVDSKSNSLLLSGSKRELDEIEILIIDLSIGEAMSDADDIRMYMIEKADPASVASTLERLFNPRGKILVNKKLVDPEPKITVIVQPQTRRILVRAMQIDFDLIEPMIKQLDTITTVISEVRVFTLENTDAADVAKNLNALFGPLTSKSKAPAAPTSTRGRSRTRSRTSTPTPTVIRQERVAQMIEFETKAGTLRADTTERINITANTKTNSVIVAAPTPVMLLVTRLIEELDQSAALTTQPIVTLLPLAHADALAIATAINRSFAPVKGEKVNPDDRVIVTPETNANAILIKASESNLAKVKILLAKLDTKESGGITTDILVLQNAQASDIQPVLQRIATGGSKKAQKGSSKTPTTVSAEPSSNAIVLSGSSLDVAMLRKMAEQLDAAATSAANGVYIIPLTSGDAESVTQMIRNLHTQELAAAKRSKRTVDPLAVSADPRANAVVLSGSKETYERVKAWVKQVEVMKPARGVVRMIPLKNADAAEVQKVINQMFDSGGSSKSSPAPSSRRRGRTPKAPTPSSSSSRVQVNIMESPRGLIVSANNEDFAVIQALVAKLETAAEKNKRHQKIFTLENAPAFRIAQSLNLIYNAKGATTTPSQIVTITAVYGSNAVLVAAPNDKLDEIGHLIKQLDDKKVAAAVEFKIFPLTHAQPAKVIKAVTRLLAQLRRAYPSETIDVQADERTRSLIVTARPAMFKEIEKIIKKLDIPPANETTQVLIMPLRNADATQLAGVLNEMLRPSAAKQVTPEARALQEQVRRLQVSSSLKDRIPPLDLNQPIQITADPSQPSGANVLLLSSTPENLRALRAIVQLLDTVPLASEMTVQLFPLEHADATRLLGILETLHTGPKGKLVRPEETPALAADARTNTLVVGASPRAFESLVPLIKRLDTKQANPAMQLTVIPMEFNDAGIVAPILEKLFAARLASTTPLGEKPNPQDRVDIVADSLSNALILSASRQNLALIKSLLVKVDIEPPTETGFVRLYPLKNSDAARVGDMLKNLVSQGLYKPGAASLTGKGKNAALTNREKVSIAIDTRTNVLIVSASRENFAVLEEIIKKVDSSDAYSLLGDIRVFILKRADATKLGPTLQAFFKEKLSAEKTAGSMGQALPVVILPDARTNAILVAGSRESFAAVAGMIEKLDSDAATPAGTFAIIPLKEATATVLQNTLQQLFDQRATRDKNAAKVTVLADTRANALIIGATAEDLVAVRALIKTLDSKGASDALAKTVRVFPLAKADAAGISETLRELYRSQGGKDSDITISIDERINALIVSGGRADLTRIGEIVKQLDREKVTRVTEIRVFTLKHADATELSELMMAVLTEKPKTPTAISPNRQTLLQFIHKMPNGGEDLISRALQEGVLITPDKRTNSLVVSATIESMPFLMNLISSLDSASPREAEIRVFTLRNSDATSMADVLQQLFRSNQTSGTSRQAPAVTYTLTGKGAKKEGEKSMAATPAKTTDISTTTGSAEQADLNITVDARTNSLLIGGTPRQLEMAEAVIKKLDASEAQQRITRVYRPHNAQAEALGAALSSFLDQERQKLTSALGADRLGAAQRMLEREVAVVAEPEANVLLISASPRYFRTIFEMIRQLDQPPAQVLIQALLAEILLDDQTQFGAEWAYTAKSGGTKTTVGPNFNVEAGIGTDATGLAVSVTGGDLTFFLRALKSQGRLELLSRPQILAADNQPAKINVGQSVPLITASRTTDQGDTINSISYEDIGVSLDVLPRIGAGDTVRMEIKPEISSLGNTFFEVAKGVEAQSINTRSAETTVTCFDGQTIIMGGLITTLERNTEDKVPILGDVPLLGLLFRNTSKEESRNEFLVFLTPRIMRTSQDLANITHNEAENQNLLRLLDTPNRFKKNAIVDLQTGALKESVGLGEDVDPNWRFKDIQKTINDLELNPAQWTRTPEPATEWSDPVHEAIYKTTNGKRNPARKGTSRPVNVAPAKTTDITPAPATKKIPVVPVRSAPVKAGSK